MSQEEFNKTVEQFKEAIPIVYDQIKKNGETYFIEAGPSTEVLAKNDSHCNMHYHGKTGMMREQSNNSLINLVDQSAPA